MFLRILPLAGHRGTVIGLSLGRSTALVPQDAVSVLGGPVTCDPPPTSTQILCGLHRHGPRLLGSHIDEPLCPSFCQQLRLYMPSEPLSFERNKKLPPDYCPVHVDNYGHVLSEFADPQHPLTAPGIRVPQSYVYAVAQLRDAFQPELGTRSAGAARSVWVPAWSRGHLADYHVIVDALKARNFTIVVGNWSNRIGEYYRALGSVKYVVLPPRARRSAGQMVGDAALMGVPAFAEDHRYMSRLTQHPMLWYANVTDMLEKLDRLEANRTLYLEACQYVVAAAHRLELASAMPPKLLAHVVCHLSKQDRRCCHNL